MYMGFRYHLASLVAVFFSLLLGILIGGALFQDDGLVEEQGVLIANMEQQFRELQVSFQQLTEREKLSQKAWEQVKQVFVKNQLAGQTVIFVAEEETPEWKKATELLTAAGADAIRARLRDFENAVLPEDIVVLVWLDQQGFDENQWADLREIVDKGTYVAFLQSSQAKLPFPQWKSTLKIDCADTFIGETALIQGLASKSIGHYGIQSGAEACCLDGRFIMRVAALIPAFNEADLILQTIKAVQTIPGSNEIVVINDGSA